MDTGAAVLVGSFHKGLSRPSSELNSYCPQVLSYKGGSEGLQQRGFNKQASKDMRELQTPTMDEAVLHPGVSKCLNIGVYRVSQRVHVSLCTLV